MISGVPQVEVETGVEYRFLPTAADDDGDTMSFNVEGLPSWAAFDGTTGELSGVPAVTDEGEYAAIVISVSDGTDSASLDPFSITVMSPPPSWVSRDVGAVSAAGALQVSGNQFAVLGSGDDIWGTNDEFHFAYLRAAGDVEIIARVLDIDPTDPLAKAGVMIRENLEDDSLFADVIVTAKAGADMHYRRPTPTWAKPRNSYDGTTASPAWVRLARIGDRFTGYKSLDGVSWLVEDETTIPMTGEVYIGLAVTSRNDGVVAKAVFDEVRIDAPLPPPQDLTPPEVPSGVTASATSPTRVLVRWAESSDLESGIGGYHVFLDGEKVATTDTTRQAIAGLQPNATYSFAVSAFDSAQPTNESERSPPVLVTTQTEAYIDVPDVVGLAIAEAESRIVEAALAVGEIRNRKSESVPKGVVIEQMPEQGTSVLEGMAVDLTVSSGAPAVETDTDPPSVPDNVRAEANGPTVVVIRWAASDDAGSGVGGYRVFRDGDFLGATASTRFTARGLDPATQYSFSVSAFDNAATPNESDRSEPAEVSTPSESGSVTLSWRPPSRNTDGSPIADLAGFVIYYGRSPGQYNRELDVNDPGRSSVTISDLEAGVWYFAASAVNDAGVESELSNEASFRVGE